MAAPIHAGVLVPWANSVVEAELPRQAPDQVVWHYSRLVPANEDTALNTHFLTGLIEAVPQAVEQLSALRLRIIYLACTSAAFMFSEMVSEVTSGRKLPIVTAFESIVGTLRDRHIGRIALCAPYPADVTNNEASMFDKAGIEVVEYATLGLSDGYADVQPQQIRTMTARLSRENVKNAEAIVLSCTGWPTLGLERPLQQRFGMPVISSNRAMAAHALSLNGAHQ